MRILQRHPLACFLGTILIFVGSACRSFPARENLTEQQIALIRADSDVFASVVRAQLAAGKKDYPYHLDSPRFDSRPSGSGGDFQSVAGGSQGFDPTQLSQHSDSATLEILAKNRKRILRVAGAEEGKPFSYPKCGGTLASPPPPPPPGSSTSAPPRRPDIHEACPMREENYLAVGMPIRGVPETLRRLRIAKDLPLDQSGEFWTAIVDERYVGPGGQNWFQHAWLFRRRPSTGRLELAHTLLLAWEE
jgi:hypothetical protein